MEPQPCWGGLKPVCLDCRVKSHTRERSRAHGTIVRPSGLLRSLRLSDAGSIIWPVSPLTPTLVWWGRWLRYDWSNDRQTWRQARPWVPAALTCSPHALSWGEQMLEPRRSPTAILTDMLSRRRSSAELRKSPAWRDHTATSRARLGCVKWHHSFRVHYQR